MVRLQDKDSSSCCLNSIFWFLFSCLHNNWNQIFVLHINTTTACDIQDILFSFLYSCYINSCHLSFLSQYSSNIWTVNTSTYNFLILISDLGCHKLWWYLCVKQKSDFNCCVRLVKKRKTILLTQKLVLWLHRRWHYLEFWKLVH